MLTDKPDAREHKVYYAYERAMHAFRRDMLQVHGEKGWAKLRGKPGITLSPLVEYDLDDFDIAIDGEKAVAHAPAGLPDLHLQKQDKRWRVSIAATLEAHAVKQGTTAKKILTFQEQVTPILRQFREEIVEGQNIKELDGKMMEAVLPLVFASGARIRTTIRRGK